MLTYLCELCTPEHTHKRAGSITQSQTNIYIIIFTANVQTGNDAIKTVGIKDTTSKAVNIATPVVNYLVTDVTTIIFKLDLNTNTRCNCDTVVDVET